MPPPGTQRLPGCSATRAFAELVRYAVRNDQIPALPKLEDTLVSLHLAVLAGRRWPAAER